VADESLNNPYVDRPDEHEAGAVNELYCWMPANADRECNGSCVAYDPRHANDARITPCMTLNAIRSLGMSLGIVANVHKQEARKVTQPHPPEVR